MVSCILRPEEAFAPIVPPINIELTSLCNLKCPYCANPTLTREYAEMPTEMIYRLADECAREGHEIIVVHGVGEPLLRKDLETILSRFNALGIWKGWMTTNGTLLSARRMEALVAAGVKGISLSMDTIDADLYRRTRGGRLDKVIDNVRTAARLFPEIHIYISLMNHKEQTVDAAVIERFYEVFRGLNNVEHRTVENGRFPGAADDWRHTHSTTEQCSSWAHFFTIAIDGRVSVCCADQQAAHVIGDVTKNSIKDIWLSEPAQDTFRRILLGLSNCPEVCYKCHLKPKIRELYDVDPLLAGSYTRARAAADAAKTRGNTGRALELLRHMKLRNPWDALLEAEIAALT